MMLDLDALALCEERLSGRPAPASLRRTTPALRLEAPAPRMPEGVSEEAMRRCPHLAAIAEKELEGVE
ncbi:MAG: hypothetical protein AAF763_16215 [Pseudomonadota bacterium]